MLYNAQLKHSLIVAVSKVSTLYCNSLTGKNMSDKPKNYLLIYHITPASLKSTIQMYVKQSETPTKLFSFISIIHKNSVFFPIYNFIIFHDLTVQHCTVNGQYDVHKICQFFFLSFKQFRNS